MSLSLKIVVPLVPLVPVALQLRQRGPEQMHHQVQLDPGPLVSCFAVNRCGH